MSRASSSGDQPPESEDDGLLVYDTGRRARARRLAAAKARRLRLILGGAVALVVGTVAWTWMDVHHRTATREDTALPPVSLRPAETVLAPALSLTPAPTVAVPVPTPAPPPTPPADTALPQEKEPSLKDKMAALASSVADKVASTVPPTVLPLSVQDQSAPPPPMSAPAAASDAITTASPASTPVDDASTSLVKRPTVQGHIEAWRMDGWPLDLQDPESLYPEELDDVVQLAVTGETLISTTQPRIATALRADGSVVCWGGMRGGQKLEVPETLKSVRDIAKLCSDGHAQSWQLYLTTSGKLIGWSPHATGESANALDHLLEMANGVRITDAYPVDQGILVLTAEGTVRAFTRAKDPNPACILPAYVLKDVAALAATGEEAVAALKDGTLVSWGKFGAALYASPPKVAFKPARLKLVPSLGLIAHGPAGESRFLPTRSFAWHAVFPDARVEDFGAVNAHSYLRIGRDYKFRTSGKFIIWRNLGATSSAASLLSAGPPWRSVPDSGYTEKSVRGCAQVAFVDGYVFALRPGRRLDAGMPGVMAATATPPAGASTADLGDPLDERAWTDAGDRKMYARFGGLEEDKVLFITGGEHRAIPLTSLSAESRELAARLHVAVGRKCPVIALIPFPKQEKIPMSGVTFQLYNLRNKLADRADMITRMGGDAEKIEGAITRSLAWLESRQNTDGSWGNEGGAGHTGAVLRCFLARGESLETQGTVERVLHGVRFLLRAQEKFTNKMFSRDPVEHGEATCALGELYLLAAAKGMIVPGVKPAFMTGVDVVVKNQNMSGGWTYLKEEAGYDNFRGNGTFLLAVANTSALCIARDTQMRFPGLGQCLTRSTSYFDKFGSSYPGESIAALRNIEGMMAPPPPKGHECLDSLDRLVWELTRAPPDWNGNWRLTTWRYNTEAFFISAAWNDAAWRQHHDLVFPQILAAQKEDGSFGAGSSKSRKDEVHDDILRQALCTLQLQVFYRVLNGM